MSTVANAGMTNGEIIMAVIAIIGLVFGIVKVWIQSQTDIAQIKVQLTAISDRLTKSDNDLKTHKDEDNVRYEQMRKENREDHGKLFEKIDKLIESKV
jgi:hypothetical protein